MKKGLLVFYALLYVFASSSLFADNIYLLYGFKIGQNINTLTQELGKPYKVHKFDDGFVGYIYKLQDCNVVFETDNTRPDIIFDIQIEGKANPIGRGLGNLNLGDSENLISKFYGKPDSIEDAKDEATGKVIPGIKYHSYDKKNNFSIETSNGKVSSIKINYKSVGSQGNKPDIDKFISAIDKKHPDSIAKWISAFFVLHINDKSYPLKKSILSHIQNDENYSSAFFSDQFGLCSLDNKNLSQSALRITDNGTGYVFKGNKNKTAYELFFVQSYDGWMLKDLYIDK